MKGKLQLVPPAPDKCQECAVKHDPRLPHDRTSLYYQMKFTVEHGFPPTWKDAMEHCTLEVQVAWERELRKRHAWDD